MATIHYSDSILASIKGLMPKTGIPQEYTVFDNELIGNINAELAVLSSLGVGKTNSSFSITGSGETWGDFIDDDELLNLIPMYVADRVKLIFDTPSSSIVLEMIKQRSAEYSFYIQDAAKRYKTKKEESE